MDLGIKGRIAVICGGARGSGLEIAHFLAREGVKVVMSGRYPDMVREAEKSVRDAGGEAVGVVADVVAPDGPEKIKEAAHKAFGAPDIMVLNIATISSNDREFMNITDEEFEKSYQAYFMAPVRMLRAFLPDMAKNRWGRVVLLGSANMKNPSPVDPLTAQAVRVGGAALLKNLTAEYGEYNISFNTLAIGAFMTELGKDYLKTAPPGSYEAYCETIPAKRWADPSELAGLVTYLCGEQSAYVNGEVIRIDGGQTKSLF